MLVLGRAGKVVEMFAYRKYDICDICCALETCCKGSSAEHVSAKNSKFK